MLAAYQRSSHDYLAGTNSSSGASVFVSSCGGMSAMPRQKQFHGSKCPDGTDVCVCSTALGGEGPMRSGGRLADLVLP
ncbi:hypothetical protein FNF29_06872 [Cafeteria roenbergensis]|uniref:Uncharacterized protein n=1 Tax=Cafeteria roenbergensis TaxID=33653 RepID=A0A5A8C5A9_CAFRO|nr:hypothetical protein FNF29_06872 [Cafeteria roenbergensis]|eukprot:KAA0148213.1 hypothetical protein FNF29_06872 [Cafeteria roenbergensis]